MCLPQNVAGASIQSIATIVGNLLCLNFGLTFGITPSQQRLYQSSETPLNRPADGAAATWVSSYLFLSAAVGALLLGSLAQKIGPKSVLLLSGLLQITGWFSIHFAYDILHIYASRIFAGIAAGATFTVLPTFIREISESDNYVSLTASIEEWRALGIMAGLALSAFLRYDYVSIVGIGISFVFTMVFPFIQESPFYYMRKQNVLSLEKSLRWFRGIRDIDDREKTEYVVELAAFKSEMSQQQIAKHSLPSAYVWKVGFLCLLLAVSAHLSGVYVIFTYASHVFSELPVTVYHLDVNILILAGAQLVGAYIGVRLVKYVSRKILLTISAAICGLSLVALSLFTIYGNHWDIDPLYAPWLPLGLLSLHMLSAHIGLHPLSTLIISEILPVDLRNIIYSVIVALTWLLQFLLIEFFPYYKPLIGLIGIFWIFAGAMLFIAIFAIMFLPETRNKSLEEVQRDLGYVGNGHVAKISSIMQGHIKNGII